MKKIYTSYFSLHTSNKGFTIIELLMYMALLSILISIISTLFSSAVNTQLEAQSTSSLEQDTRFIISRLTYDIHRADSIISPALAPTTSDSLQIQIDGVNYLYSQNSGNLEVDDGTNLYQLNSLDTSIESLSFQQIGTTSGKNTIRVVLTLQSKIQQGSGLTDKVITTTIGLR